MTARETILITGARAPVALDLARAFRAAGFDTHLADCVTPFATRALRPSFPIHRLPAPRTDFAGFRAEAKRLVETLDLAMVIPTCEEVFWLSEAAMRDGWRDRLFAPPLPVLSRLHSKLRFAELAAKAGLDVPETIAIDRPLSEGDLPFPREDLVLKPEFSRFATHTLVAPTPDRIARLRPTPAHRWVAQRRIRGEEVCSWAAVHEGRIMAFAAYRPLWRHGQAAAFQMEAITSSAARDVTERIAVATGMTGHLSFDLIVDETGRALPIECNPRAVSGLHLFDPMAGLAQAVMGRDILADPPAGRLRHMAPAMVLLGTVAALGSGRLRQLRRDWQQSVDVIDRERRGLVTLGCLADAARFAFQAMKNGLSPAGATTADIEWDGEPMP